MDDLIMKGKAPYLLPISEVDARKHVEEMQEAHMVEALHSLCTMRSDNLNKHDNTAEENYEYTKHLESRVLM